MDPITPRTRHGRHFSVHALPTPGLLQSLAGASHYSGASEIHRPVSPTSPRKSGERRHSHGYEATKIHEGLLDELKELFCGGVTEPLLKQRWREDAHLESPLGTCQGYAQYANYWMVLSKITQHSERISQRVLQSTASRLVYWQIQDYTLRITGVKKRIESIVTVELDESERILSFIEEWNGHPRSGGTAVNYVTMWAKLALGSYI